MTSLWLGKRRLTMAMMTERIAKSARITYIRECEQGDPTVGMENAAIHCFVIDRGTPGLRSLKRGATMRECTHGDDRGNALSG